MFHNPNRIAVRTVGVQIKNSSGSLVVDHSESCYRNESRFQVFYDGPELGYKFKHNASYKFRFFIKHEGKRYYTSWKTVTTH